jgi:hypothetical protein
MLECFMYLTKDDRQFTYVKCYQIFVHDLTWVKIKIFGDLNVIGLLLAMQSGYTNYGFLCEWDGRAKNERYKMKDLPLREN